MGKWDIQRERVRKTVCEIKRMDLLLKIKFDLAQIRLLCPHSTPMHLSWGISPQESTRGSIDQNKIVHV